MRAEIFLQGLIGFLIVSFGQPSFSPYLAPIAGALGYAIFWRAIRIYPFWKQRFWRAGIWFASISLIHLSWMTSIEFQGIYMLFVWLGLCILLGLQFGILSILIPYNQRLKLPRILAIASIWTLLEWSRFYFICGYTWNFSGIALSNVYAIQFASIFGVLGLSFWVIFSNLMALRAFLKKGITHYLVWAAVACFPYFFGFIHIFYHEKQISRAENPSRFSCLLVQTGLLPSEKTPLQGKVQAFISPYDQWKRILVLVKAHQGSHPDLIVLPEAAVPFSSGAAIYYQKDVERIFFQIFGEIPAHVFPKRQDLFGDPQTQKVSNAFWVQALSNYFNSEVILGLDHTEHDGKQYNSAFHAKPFSISLARYDKRVLVPLAEYLPLDCLKSLVSSYGITDFFTPGLRATIFDGKIPISASICYEETFPHKIREGRLLGARLLVNVTNDGWYPFSRLSSQHFEHAKFRAVENGISLIRACNTGVSAVVDPLGRTINKLDEQKCEKQLCSGTLFAELFPYEYRTLYMFWGNAGILSVCLIFVGIFVGLKRQYYW